ncbi:fimbria/pilus chaperone family protein [Serratia microhaemolytica]|uniref:fimbria/pilus chaperone family protein n=1 Tax=Serratia microhaemolytica TaxID=2675110 RepID=UPI000FDE808F|nr:fimbria/pilus chaperone family protein [Serratia microhaemolytica]
MINNNIFKSLAMMLLLIPAIGHSTGVIPETSVVIVEEEYGEGAITLQNSDNFPVLLLTKIQNIKEDNEILLTVTPPVARLEPGKAQRVRFIITSKTALKTERLKRVIFEGIPPQQKDKTNKLQVTIRQNLPVIIRPAGLAREDKPWRHLVWQRHADTITVNNPSAYVVRINQSLQTLPDNSEWILPATYVLPGQTLTLRPVNNSKKWKSAQRIRLNPVTTWGHSTASYDANLIN